MTNGTILPRAFRALEKIFLLRTGLFVRHCVTGVVLLLRMLSPHVSAPLAVVALCSTVVASAATTVTAPAEKRTFNLPRGNAAVTLKQFAAAAGTPIVYLVDRVRGVTTNAVSGEFTPREALDRMLAGSALEAAQDAATGAFVVSRKRTAEATPRTGEVGPVSDPQPKAKANSMKSPRTLLTTMKPNRLLTTLTAVVAFIVGSPADGQTGGPARETGIVEGRVLNTRNGEYLKNARITIAESSLEAFTDETGSYRIPGVPGGRAKIDVFFTGLESQSEVVVIRPGETTQRDFKLSATEQRRTVDRDGIVKLSEFVVGASREMEGAAIAINERRFAPNLVNVLSVDEFGAMPDGSVGEFLKFLPGINIGYGGGIANTISMDGVPANNVPVTIAGFDLASSASGEGSNRQNVLSDVSTNNLSRVEVVLSPTPDSPAKALAGSVNFVPRSAFERSRPQFNFNTFVIMRDNERSLGKTPGPRAEPTHKIQPGFDLSYIRPVNKNFGFTLSAGRSNQYTPDDLARTQWRGVSAPTNPTAGLPDTTPDKPYLTQFVVGDRVKFNGRYSAGVTADYRLGPHDRVSFSLTYGSFSTNSANRTLAFQINRVNPGDFTPFSTRSQPGQGELIINQPFARKRDGFTYTPTLVYRHDGPVWKAEAGAGHSRSKNEFTELKDSFGSTQARRTNVTVVFNDIFYLRPREIQVFDGTTGAPVDPYNLSNYALATASGAPSKTADLRRSAYANLRREFSVRGVPVTLKAGVDINHQQRDARADSIPFTFRGPGTPQPPAVTVPTPANNAGIVLDESFSQRIAPYGFPRIQWISNEKLWALYQTNPGYFTRDENAAYRSTTAASRRSEETVTSAYLRADAAFLDRRLRVVGGVRFEQTNVNGEGPLTHPTGNFQRDAAGNIVYGPNGLPVLVVPTTDALGVSRRTLIDRGYQSKKEYLRAFPSLKATYNLRDNLLLKAAHYHSIGRPNFGQYSGGLTLPDTEVGPSPTNRISVNNVGIKPWAARTTKVRIEFYFQNGASQLSVGAFRRDFKNFFGSTVFPASPEFLALYDVDPAEYLPYEVATNYNIADGIRSQGLELDYHQRIGFFPKSWGSLQVRGNITALRNLGPVQSNFGEFVPRTYNGTVYWRQQRYSLRTGWNHTAIRRGAAVDGRSIEPGTFNWTPARTYLDVEAQYNFWKSLSIYANLRNVKDVPIDEESFGPNTPEHAQFRARNANGALWTFGVRGSF